MLTSRYREMYENGEITLEQAEAFSAEVFDMLTEDQKAKAVWRYKKVQAFEKAMKAKGVNQNMILRTIHCYRTGRRMSEAHIKNDLPKVTELFNEFFRCCKGGEVFCWKEYADIYEMEL